MTIQNFDTTLQEVISTQKFALQLKKSELKLEVEYKKRTAAEKTLQNMIFSKVKLLTEEFPQ